MLPDTWTGSITISCKIHGSILSLEFKHLLLVEIEIKYLRDDDVSTMRPGKPGTKKTLLKQLRTSSLGITIPVKSLKKILPLLVVELSGSISLGMVKI
jgi:hypothetical protein